MNGYLQVLREQTSPDLGQQLCLVFRISRSLSSTLKLCSEATSHSRVTTAFPIGSAWNLNEFLSHMPRQAVVVSDPVAICGVEALTVGHDEAAHMAVPVSTGSGNPGEQDVSLIDLSRAAQPPDEARQPGTSRLAAVLIVLAFVLVAVGAVGHLGHGLVWIARLDHVFVLGVAAVCCLGLGLLLREPATGWRVAIVLVATLGAVGWAAIGHEVGAPNQVAALDARSEPGRQYEAVVVDEDPLTLVVMIRQTEGLSARQWVAGCLYDDSGDTVLLGLQWAGPGQLNVTTNVGRGQVRVNESSGRPGARSGRAWGNC